MTNDFPEPTWWNGDDDRPMDGRAVAYRCVDCAWTGSGASACDHHTRTGHAVRGRDWPEDWPNCQFGDADATGRRRQEVHRVG